MRLGVLNCYWAQSHRYDVPPEPNLTPCDPKPHPKSLLDYLGWPKNPGKKTFNLRPYDHLPSIKGKGQSQVTSLLHKALRGQALCISQASLPPLFPSPLLCSHTGLCATSNMRRTSPSGRSHLLFPLSATPPPAVHVLCSLTSSRSLLRIPLLISPSLITFCKPVTSLLHTSLCQLPHSFTGHSNPNHHHHSP